MKNTSKILLSLALPLVSFSVGAQSSSLMENGTFELHGAQTSPAVVTENVPFEVVITGYNLGGTALDVASEEYGEYEVSVEGSDILLDYLGPGGTCLDPTPPLPGNVPQRRVFKMPGIAAGDYTLKTRYRFDYSCSDIELESEQDIKVYAASNTRLTVTLETPSAHLIASGVGLIRGWACYAFNREGYGSMLGELAYQIDDGPLQPLSYGTARGDTSTACGENNTRTGFGAVIYWGLYKAGQHDFRLYVDGQESAYTRFEVASSNNGFLKGIDASYELQGFPEVGNAVTVEWSEADQNFTITDFR